MSASNAPKAVTCLAHIKRVLPGFTHVIDGEKCDSVWFSINQVTYNVMQVNAYWSQFPSTRPKPRSRQ